MKRAVTLTLSEDLVEEIDEKRGVIPRSRFVEMLILRIFGEEDEEEEVMVSYG